jgi:hypothetical protein
MLKLYKVTVEVASQYQSGKRVHQAIISLPSSTAHTAAIATVTKYAENFIREKGNWQQTPSGQGSQSQIEPPSITCTKYEELSEFFMYGDTIVTAKTAA